MHSPHPIPHRARPPAGTPAPGLGGQEPVGSQPRDSAPPALPPIRGWKSPAGGRRATSTLGTSPPLPGSLSTHCLPGQVRGRRSGWSHLPRGGAPVHVSWTHHAAPTPRLPTCVRVSVPPETVSQHLPTHSPGGHGMSSRVRPIPPAWGGDPSHSGDPTTGLIRYTRPHISH